MDQFLSLLCFDGNRFGSEVSSVKWDRTIYRCFLFVLGVFLGMLKTWVWGFGSWEFWKRDLIDGLFVGDFCQGIGFGCFSISEMGNSNRKTGRIEFAATQTKPAFAGFCSFIKSWWGAIAQPNPN